MNEKTENTTKEEVPTKEEEKPKEGLATPAVAALINEVTTQPKDWDVMEFLEIAIRWFRSHGFDTSETFCKSKLQPSLAASKKEGKSAVDALDDAVSLYHMLEEADAEGHGDDLIMGVADRKADIAEGRHDPVLQIGECESPYDILKVFEVYLLGELKADHESQEVFQVPAEWGPVVQMPLSLREIVEFPMFFARMFEHGLSLAATIVDEDFAIICFNNMNWLASQTRSIVQPSQGLPQFPMT